MQKIGFIGLGDMGIYMSRNLLRAGYFVQGFDMNPERMEQFKQNGGLPCSSNRQVGENIDVAVIMVFNADQVRSVMFEKNGLLETLREGATVIITATIGMKSMEDIAAEAAKKGIHIIDCAVTGGQIGAEAGVLTMMVSGSKDTIDECRDILDVIGTMLVIVGDKPGYGQLMKHCNGILSTICTIGTCEAMAFGIKAGLDPQQMIEVLGNGTGSSPTFKHDSNKILSRQFSGGGVQLKTLYKDTNLLMEMAKDLEVPLYETAICNEIIHAAFKKFPTEDNWAIIKLYEDIIGVEVK
ncbi:MAG: NAD(P)-dependent oxidoreductase [Christensenellales bacterium]